MRVNSNKPQQVVSKAKEKVQDVAQATTGAVREAKANVGKAVGAVGDAFNNTRRLAEAAGDRGKQLLSNAHQPISQIVDTSTQALSQAQRQVNNVVSNGARALDGLGDQAQRLARNGDRVIDQLGTQAERLVNQGQRQVDNVVRSGRELIDEGMEKFNRLSDAEKGFLATNPHLALPFNHAADRADELATQHSNQHLQGDENNTSIYGDGAANAIRHAAWNALMVREAYKNPLTFGNLDAAAGKAQEMADAHENNPRNTNRTNMEMDLHNNDVGRQVAMEVLRNNPNASEQEIFQAVVKAYEDGRLREVSNGQLTTAQ